jgi:hypothetical protein
MRDHHYDRILASTALSLMLAIPLGAFAQDSEERAATFNERFPAEQTSTQPSLEVPEAHVSAFRSARNSLPQRPSL